MVLVLDGIPGEVKVPQFEFVLTGYAVQATWPAALYRYDTVCPLPFVVLVSSPFE